MVLPDGVLVKEFKVLHVLIYGREFLLSEFFPIFTQSLVEVHYILAIGALIYFHLA